MRAELIARIEQATGRQARIDGPISISLLPTVHVSAGGIGLAGVTGDSEDFSVESVSFGVSLLPLLSGKVALNTITIVKPVLVYAIDENGGSNWASAAPAQAEPDPSKPQSMEDLIANAGEAAPEQAAQDTLAALDRIVEVPYHYMRARLQHDAGDFAAAEKDWRLLRAIWAWQNDAPAVPADWPVSVPRVMPLMHPYDAALVLVLSAATEDCLTGGMAWDGRKERLDEAEALFKQVKRNYFGDKRAHFDLVDWIDLVEEIADKGGAAVDLPEPNFITAE